MSQSDLLERFRTDRSREALDRLIAEYWPMVLSVCRRYFAQPADAEDAAQETFLKLVRRVDQIHGNVAAWLSATARTTSIDLLRRRRRGSMPFDTQALGEMTPTAPRGETIGWSMLFSRLDEAMGSLGASERELIVERFFRQTPLRVIAGQNQTSVSTASRRCGEALRQLGETFADMGIEPPDAEALAGWLQRIDPAKRAGAGCDGHALLAGDWSDMDPMRHFQPGAESPLPEGWQRPIRVGVLMSWRNWRRPSGLGFFSTPGDTTFPLRFIEHPGYELFAVVDPGTSSLGEVERTIREYEVMGGLMNWDSAEDLAKLDVLVVGHTFSIATGAVEKIYHAVRGGVGLYNESYFADGAPASQDSPMIAELCLAKLPMYSYCTPGRHSDPRPLRVEKNHPIIDGLGAGDRFFGPGCGVVFEPADGANVIISREDPVRPTYIDAPNFAERRMAVLLSGQVGDGRVVMVNSVLGLPFHHHPALRGRFATNCFNWLAEPRREQQA